MLIEPRVIDDLKTERPDISPALPGYLRIVPFAFYGGAVAAVLLTAFFFSLLQKATQARDRWQEDARTKKEQLARVRAERTSVEGQAKRASEVIAWVEGSRAMQPLAADIARSMSRGASIAEMALDRDSQNPSQIKLTLKLNAQSTKQLDSTIEKVLARNFRAYNPNQTQSKGEIDYQATLIWQGNRAKPANEQ